MTAELQKICEKWMWKTFQMGLKQSPFDADNSEFYAPMIGLNLSKQMAEEIEQYASTKAEEVAIEFYGYMVSAPDEDINDKTIYEVFKEWFTQYKQSQ